MTRVVRGLCAVAILLAAAACGPGWKHRGGALVLPASRLSRVSGDGAAASGPDSPAPPVPREASPSRRLSLALPEEWNWVRRGDDFVATRDGVFLQNIVVERIHVDQATQSDGAFPLAALSSKQWPVRTVKGLKRRFSPGMSPAAAAGALLDSRRNDPAVAGLEVREVATRTVAGHPGFRAVFDFTLNKAAFGFPLNYPAGIPPYRSVCYGFLSGEWFYGIEYTAAARHYFGKDAETFEAVARSVVLGEE